MTKTATVHKAIVLAGGTGGRLSMITRGLRNKVNIEIHGKPLIAYLLRSLEENGIKEVALVVRPDHEEEFRSMIETKKYPRLNYRIIHTPFQESGYRTSVMLAKVLQDPALKEFVGNQPVLLGFGDTYYFPRFVKRALIDFGLKKRALFLSGPERTTIPYEEAYHEYVVESQQVAGQKYAPTIHGLIAPPEFFRAMQQKVSTNRGIMEVLRLMHESGFRSGIMHGQVINLNYPADYIALREVIAGRLRFPFPPKWVKGFVSELEELAQRRERKPDYKKRMREAGRHRRK